MAALLTPFPVGLTSDEFRAIAEWPFADPFVGRMIRDDFPILAQLGDTSAWVYRDAAGQTVGFGTLRVCGIYAQFTGGSRHTYIPLLAKNPSSQMSGVGKIIVDHLAAESALLIASYPDCNSDLFLDVYTTSLAAIKTYLKAGFVNVVDQTFRDDEEGGEEYLVMARRVGVA